MFKKSSKNTNPTLFGGIAQQLKGQKLNQFSDPLGWHNLFNKLVTSQIDEQIFEVLYDSNNGRPNAPVRILVSMMILKEGHGWSDEELFQQSRFNLLVMSALGQSDFGDSLPAASTYYKFRSQLFEHQLENGKDLLGDCFSKLTAAHCELFNVKGDSLRMDSKLIGSNIAICSKLQLVINCLKQFYKHLSPSSKRLLQEASLEKLDSMAVKSSGQFVYPLSNIEKEEWLIKCGHLLQELLGKFGPAEYKHYALIKRVFEDKYCLSEDDLIQLRAAEELSSDNLQSAFDEDAQYRFKRGEAVRGYSVNLVETCDEAESCDEAGSNDGPDQDPPSPPLNLITQVQVEGAALADKDFVEDGIENSEPVSGKTKEVIMDGAYYSPENDQFAEKNGIDLHFTGFPGKKGRFEFEYDEHGKLQVRDTQTGLVSALQKSSGKKGLFKVEYQKDGKTITRYFYPKEITQYFRRKEVEELPEETANRRCNVEASIFQLCFITRNNKTRYRGKYKTQMWATSRCAWINLRRMVKYVMQLPLDHSLSKLVFQILLFLFQIVTSRTQKMIPKWKSPPAPSLNLVLLYQSVGIGNYSVNLKR